jgi:integrase
MSETSSKRRDGSVTQVGPDKYRLRFRVPGYGRQSATLTDVTRQHAEDELVLTLAKVRRGEWEPPAPAIIPPANIGETMTLEDFAWRWYAGRARGLAENSQRKYRTWMRLHLLASPLGHLPLVAIDVAEVDDYRDARLAAGAAPSSVNGELTLLGQILDSALERRHIARNPMRVNARNRKARAKRPRLPHLSSAGEIVALLEAAGELDREAPFDKRHVPRRTIVATLVFAGLRIGELCALHWRDVDLPNRRLHVRAGKTAAATRTIDLEPVLLDELGAWAARCRNVEPDAFVFASKTQKYAIAATNVRARVVGAAVQRANENLRAAGLAELPRVSPHGLRRTYVSVMLATGKDIKVTMDQVGHADSAMTLETYGRVMRYRDGERDELRALLEGIELEPLEAPAPAAEA